MQNDREDFLEKLKKMYAPSFDLTEDAASGGWIFPVYGHFNVDNAGYVLSKKAKLWEANCQEHLFVLTDTDEAPFEPRMLARLDRWLRETAEPVYVRKGEALPPKDHMYTYLTVVLVTDRGIDAAAAQFVKKYHFERSYRFQLRGYLKTRMVIVSTKERTVITNPQGKSLVNNYHKLLRHF